MTTDRDAADYLAKAQESLASAEADYAAARFNSCMNRCYYACFQAALSALVSEGIVSAHIRHEHDFVQAQFNDRLIRRRKLFPQRIARVLRAMIVQRHEADYRPTGVSRRASTKALATARDYVGTIRTRYS